MNDFVNRQDLLDGIEELKQSPWFKNGEDKQDIRHYGYLERKEAVEVVTDLCIKKESSVTPKEKTGHWISFGIQGEIDGQIVRAFTCSKCGAISIFRVSNGNIVNGGLCPNCGARMQEVNEDGM